MALSAHAGASPPGREEEEEERRRDLDVAIVLSLPLAVLARAAFIVKARADRQLGDAVLAAYALGGGDAVRAVLDAREPTL